MAVNKTVNKQTKTHGAMRNCLEYVLRKGKTEEHLAYITGPYAYDELDYDKAYQSFLAEKKLWGKDSGRMYAHNIISWHKDEAITPGQALEFGKAFAEEWFSGFQTVVAVHKDKDHIHCHLVTNSVSYEDGHKLHNSKKDMERMKQLTNQMCKERNLSIAEKGKHFDGTQMKLGDVTAWSKDKYNLFKNEKAKSYVMECAMAVISAIKHCISKEVFIQRMDDKGWKVNWNDNRKHITFQNQQGQKVRDSNLSKTFHLNISKEALYDEFNRENERRRKEDRTEGIQSTGDGTSRNRTRERIDIQDTDAFIRHARLENRNAKNVVGESRTDRRKSETAARTVRNAENQSITDAKQRCLAEQQRLDAQKRAREISRRNKRRSDLEL